ncbi:MAG TPA: 4Fe-4S binding protein, partial [Candidatus Ozemobacteraceae bacterium]|nr:4Fe-4S binding protein [Candidatus Ozemobacteraceae bacterium]
MRAVEQAGRFLLSVASRHGGLASTALAVDLALLFADAGYETALIDADASYPSVGSRLAVAWEEASGVAGVQPEIDALRCQRCGACSDFCAFGALELHSDGIRRMPGACNGCGGCRRVCPSHAISEKQRLLGSSRQGSAGPHLTVIAARLAPDARCWEAATAAWLKYSMRMKPVQIIKAPPGLGRVSRESWREADR